MIAGLLAAAQNADAPVLVAQNIAFAVIAAIMVFSAIRVVSSPNVVHAAVYLVMVLAGAAAQFILLGAEFVAITQVLVYIGAVMVLFLFGVMLTKAPIEGREHLSRDNWLMGIAAAVPLLGLMVFALLDGFGRDRLPGDLAPTSIGDVSDTIFGSYLIPFEAISLLLLAAAIGAIVISGRE